MVTKLFDGKKERPGEVEANGRLVLNAGSHDLPWSWNYKGRRGHYRDQELGLPREELGPQWALLAGAATTEETL